MSEQKTSAELYREYEQLRYTLGRHHSAVWEKRRQYLLAQAAEAERATRCNPKCQGQDQPVLLEGVAAKSAPLTIWESARVLSAISVDSGV